MGYTTTTNIAIGRILINNVKSVSTLGKRNGLIVCVLDSGLCGLSFRPRQSHCVLLLGKIFCSHSASHHHVIQMGTSEFNSGSNPAMD